jgi:hypothetical protein
MATPFDFANFGNMFGGMQGGTPTGLDALLSEDQRKLMGRNATLAAAAALLQASGRSTTPISFGQALGSALQAGQQGYTQARAGSVQDLVLGEKLKEAQTAREFQKQIAGVFTETPPMLSPEQQALMAPNMQLGPTNARAELAANIPPPSGDELLASQYRRAAQIAISAGKSEDAKRLMDIAKELRPVEEYSTTPQFGNSAGGTPISFVLSKSGNMKLLNFNRSPEFNYQDTGSYISVRDKNTNKELERIPKSMTPGETATNLIAKENLGINRANLGVAQAGLGLRQAEFNRGAFDRVETPDGFVNIPKAGGPAVPIMGPGGTQLKGTSGGKLTEGETNAAGFAQRMELAQSIFDKLPAGSQPGAGTRILESVPFVGGAMARQFAQDANTQMYDQAAQDWIRAKLRKESGAAIGVDEARQEYATYFPMVGDTAEKIAQKAEARRVVTLGMQKAAGKAYTPYTPAGRNITVDY